MKDKIVIITGANTGMGRITAIELAKKGAHIVMVCRNPQTAEAAKKEIIELSGNPDVDLLIADLSSQQSIRELAATINKNYTRVDILVNNAGLILSEYSETVDGIETVFATNVLSMYMLSILLLDKLKQSEEGRIINIASSVHKGALLNWEDLGFKQKYSMIKTYNQSKLCNIILTYRLAEKLKGTNITVNTLNPGPVKTELARNMGMMFKLMVKLFFISPAKGAETAIYLASSPEVKGITGKYFEKSKLSASSKESMDNETGKRLWDLCAKMTGVDL